MSAKSNSKTSVNKPDIEFVTPKNLSVKLIFDKEYRAFKKVGSQLVAMNLGGSDPEALKQYINSHF